MTKITNDNAVEELLKRIPELKDYSGFDKENIDLSTVIFDYFGDFLLDRVLSDSSEDPIIKKSFDLINEMMKSEDSQVQNLPVVGVFEALAGNKKGIEVAEKLLNEHGLRSFGKVKKDFLAN